MLSCFSPSDFFLHLKSENIKKEEYYEDFSKRDKSFKDKNSFLHSFFCSLRIVPFFSQTALWATSFYVLPFAFRLYPILFFYSNSAQTLNQDLEQ